MNRHIQQIENSPDQAHTGNPANHGDLELAIGLTESLHFPDTGAAEDQQQDLIKNGSGPAITISSSDIEQFVLQVLRKQAEVDAKQWAARHQQAATRLDKELGIGESHEIPVDSLLKNLSELGVQRETMEEAAQRYKNLRSTNEALDEWRKTLRMPAHTTAAVFGEEAIIRKIVESLKSSLRDTIMQARHSPHTLVGGACKILIDKQLLDDLYGADTKGDLGDRAQAFWGARALSQNHGVLIEERSITLQIPNEGRRDTFELLSPEIKEIVARPEPTNFFGRLLRLITGPTMEVTHPEKRGRPITSPALLDLCDAIEAAGAFPKLDFLASESHRKLNVRVSIWLDNPKLDILT